MSQATLLRVLDGIIGPALCHLLPRPAGRDLVLPPNSRFLFIRPGGIGDALLLVPVLNAVSRHFPDGVVDVLAEERNAGAFALAASVNRVWRYDRPGQVAKALKSRYEVVVDTEQWYRLSAVVSRFVSASQRIGYATNQRRRMFTHAVEYRQTDYEALSFLRLLRPLGIVIQELPSLPWLVVPTSASDRLAQLISVDERQVVTIFPGASRPEKRWATDNYRQVAMALLEHGVRVVLTGGAQDKEVATAIADGLDVTNLVGMSTLSESAALLQVSDVLISGDSGVLHMAAGLGIPTVSLFGPSSRDKWAPQGEKHRVISRGLPCAPCSRYGKIPACTRRVECMAGIAPQEVLAVVVELLGSQGEKE